MTTPSDKLNAIYRAYSTDDRFKDLRQRGINFVPGKGPINPKIMLVGEFPGFRENRKQEPFVGKAGQHLSVLMKEHGLDLDDVFKTNLLKYWPRDPFNGHRPRKITDEERTASVEYLQQEIEALNPKIVGLCGLSVVQSILPAIHELYQVNGELLEGKYVPLYQSAYVMYYPQRRPVVSEGFKKLATYAG